LHHMIYWAFNGTNPIINKDVEVHHINCNKHDNSFENLEVLTKVEHRRKMDIYNDVVQSIDYNAIAYIDEYPDYQFHRSGIITSKQTGKELGSKETEHHYIRCDLKDKDGNTRKCRLHRMIYWAFSGGDPGIMEVDHINQNKDDNSFPNLQLLSKSEHTKKTNQDNPGIGAKSALKTVKALIRIDSTGAEQKFESVTAAFKDMGKELSGHITKSCNTGSLYCGFKWKWDTQEMHANCEWKRINVSGCEQDIYANDEGYIKTKHVVTKGNLNTDSYYTFVVKMYGKKVEKGVHQLVCSAFEGPKPDWATSVNHIDRNRTNNRPENLQWSNAIDQGVHSGFDVTLLKISDNTTHEFNSVKSASAHLTVSEGRLNRAWKNKTEIDGFKVVEFMDRKAKI
jgi:hypothetical protein